MLIASQIDFKVSKQKLLGSNHKSFKTAKSVSKQNDLQPTNGTLLAIKQMEKGNLPVFNSVKEMMDSIG